MNSLTGRNAYRAPVLHPEKFPTAGLMAMPSESEEYRAKAEECERLAASTWDQNDKVRYQELARKWRELAATVEILRRR
jgi:hypothetical protein